MNKGIFEKVLYKVIIFNNIAIYTYLYKKLIKNALIHPPYPPLLL